MKHRGCIVSSVNVLILGGSLLGCSPRDPQGVADVTEALTTSSGPQEGLVESIEIADGKVVSRSTQFLTSAAYKVTGAPSYSKPSTPAVARRKLDERLEPAIQQAEKRGGGADLVEVGITFPEDQAATPFPEPFASEDRGSPRNLAVQEKTRQMIADIEAARAPGYASKEATLGAQHGAKATGKFWLINAMTMLVPYGQLRALAARDDVQFVESLAGNSPPPSNLLVEARADLVSDPYFGYPYDTFVGLLDTGVRTTHQHLNSFAAIQSTHDCVNGTGANCTGSGLDPSDVLNHGSAAASAIIGNNNFGNDNRGITQKYLDSYRVYSNSTGLDVTDAVVRAFQAAVNFSDRLIVANVQNQTPDNGMIATAADAAFDRNAAVIAPAGNQGPNASTVTSPGIAHKALAIGAVQVNNIFYLKEYSGRGPTPSDFRTKPDLLGPTEYNAASSASNTAFMLYTGTSAAAPAAGATSALMRSFLKSPSSFEFSPGFLYASMLAYGQNFTFPAFDNDHGAGLINCPTNGFLSYGAVTVNPGATVNVPISVATPVTSIDVAIWWPESVTQAHNDVDMFLMDPSSVMQVGSTSSAGVWEKARLTTNLVAGTWTVAIKAFSVSAPQTVYWSVFKHN
jgi:serine protease AprX